MTALKKISSIAVATAITALGALPSAAHHSTAAFDNSRVVKLEGTITQFRWINPHASIKIDAKSEGDEPDGVWTIEMTAPNVLINDGWTRTALKVGDKVIITGAPSRGYPKDPRVRMVTLTRPADGFDWGKKENDKFD